MSNLLRESSEQHLVDHENRQESYQHAISWLIAWAAFALAALLGFSRLSYGLLLPALQLDLGSSFSVLGALATVNFAGYLLGTLVVPILLTRAQNRARLNLLALFATNLLMIVSASSFTIWQLSIWRLQIGFFSAIATIGSCFWPGVFGSNRSSHHQWRTIRRMEAGLGCDGTGRNCRSNWLFCHHPFLYAHDSSLSTEAGNSRKSTQTANVLDKAASVVSASALAWAHIGLFQLWRWLYHLLYLFDSVIRAPRSPLTRCGICLGRYRYRWCNQRSDMGASSRSLSHRLHPGSPARTRRLWVAHGLDERTRCGV